MKRFTLNLPNQPQKSAESVTNPSEIPAPSLLDAAECTPESTAQLEIPQESTKPSQEPMKESIQEPVQEQLAYTKTTEILTDIFEFVPTQILDTIINAMNSLIYEAIAEVEKYIEEQLGQGPKAEKIVSELITLFESAFDKNFDKFEIFALKNIFNIPAHCNVRLPHLTVRICAFNRLINSTRLTIKYLWNG